MDINQLTPDLTPSLNDLLPLWSTSQGLTRKVPVSALAALLAPTSTGVLGGATVAVLNGGASTIALTTTPAPINPFTSGLSWPTQSSANAFAYDAVNGNFVAQRAVKLADFTVALTGTWAAGVDLVLTVTVGPDATPYTLTPQATKAGAVTAESVVFGGYALNQNNLNAVINAGDKIKLNAALRTAGNLTITAVQMAVKSLDGV